MNDLLTVRINNPKKIIWEGKASSVSSENQVGVFDILPQHANFVTIVEKKPIVVQSSGAKQEYSFKNAVIYAHDDKVSIYTDIE